MASAKKTNKAHILFRYGLVTIAFVVFGICILVKLFNTTVIEANEWNRRAHRELSVQLPIPPERGNILADNGNILACNLRVYDIRLDLRHEVIKALPAISMASIDSLADSLDRYYPRIPDFATASPERQKEYSWHTRLKREIERPADSRQRALRLAHNKSLSDYERIVNFPFLKQFKRRRHPLYKEGHNVRIYPYGKMAYRSIGRVNEDSVTREFHGYSGLEKDLDKLLYGKPGISRKVAMTSGIRNWTATPPQRGFDIHTTIDIDLQDMLEEELHKICCEANAEWGTAILMEVRTGEIKAISNIELLADGTYGEALNRAVQAFEPGSVMKPISLMIAFEDGLVKGVNDMVDCSPFMKTSDPHGGGAKTMKQVIEQSSNTGIARVVFRGYAQNPEKWHDRLASLGFFEPIGSGIAGEQTPRIRRLTAKDSKGRNITMTARHLDLARQAYGYNTELPPLFTLSVYNAIANDGKYVRPHLVKGLIDENGRDSVLKIDYIRDSICSRATARKVRECIREVVWGDHGTARMVRDDRVCVVGKTGTAYPVVKGQYDKSKRRYAFAGFFPYDCPQYSCMALVMSGAGNSANRTSGQVVKNMAIKMYSRGMLNNASSYSSERRESTPVLAASTSNFNRVSGALGIKSMKRVKSAAEQPEDRIPDVRGYDLPTAVRLLEARGINVSTRGAGHVYAQSKPAGAACRRGDNITLELRTK